MLSSVFFVVGGLLLATATGIVSLVLGRVVTGLGLGIVSVASPVYTAEIAPKEHRGSYTGMLSVMINFGSLLGIVFGMPQSGPPVGPSDVVRGLDGWYWRLLLSFPGLTAVVQLVLFGCLFPIDSPSNMTIRGKTQEARALIFRLHGREQLLSDGAHADIDCRVREMEGAIAEASSIQQVSCCQAMLDPWTKLGVTLGVGLSMLQQMNGVTCVVTFSNKFFQEAGILPSHLTLASSMMLVCNLLATVAACYFVDRAGRRTLLLFGCGIQALSLWIVSMLFELWKGGTSLPPEISILTVIFFSTFVIGFNVGLGPVTMMYLSEIYPVDIRGSMISICGVITWVGCWATVSFGRLLSLHRMCETFAVITSIGLMFIFCLVVETKGSSIDDSPVSPRGRRASSPVFSPATTPLGLRELDGKESEHSSTWSFDGAK